MKPSLNEVKISPCETHHVFHNTPLYPYRFEKVLKFHFPGFAPARDHTGAFHITINGKPAYEERYKQTFGIYCSRAAVETDTGWCHINLEGKPIYNSRYAWCGNYQENLCSVRDIHGNYFHIDIQGKRLYPEHYRYVGDFKEGMAVVCIEDGQSYHIDEQGKFVHTNGYQVLDVFHKNFARAKDEAGWFHVTKKGLAAYNHRFSDIEPFYNGQAFAQTHTGARVIINEEGQVIREIFSPVKYPINDLSSEFVGFWKSETIKLAIELGLIDILPSKVEEVARRCHLTVTKVERVLRALNEIGIVKKSKAHWVLTDKGCLLAPTNKSFMAAASQMWRKVQNEWADVKKKLMEEDAHHPTFKEESKVEKELEVYRRALEGYALLDFEEVSKWKSWDQYSSLIAFGQTGITLLREILTLHPLINGIFACEDRAIYHFNIEPNLQNRLTKVVIEYNKTWNISAEAVLMPRFLHYFPDKDVLNLLEKVNKILLKAGHLYIFEMILNPENSVGGLLDLNMLVESGGRLRTYEQWKELLAKANFSIIQYQRIKPYLYLIQAGKR